MVDRNEIEGALDKGVGRVKDAAGGLTGDLGLQADGKVDQLQGHVQQEYGGVIDQLRDQVEEAAELVRDRPLAALGIAAGFGFVLGLLLVPSRG
ncbi:CsbD family protein [Acetobacteraceae bacterium KSS8]|uniref:CsbD family protein n=1 Tax=Endosaccharibacter trunci TaxID=2812733 RepID=A0ABT1W2B4_9PROT|nr:CsbD family protein [Acetobacteraceae bacterium KSS8]